MDFWGSGQSCFSWWGQRHDLLSAVQLVYSYDIQINRWVAKGKPVDLVARRPKERRQKIEEKDPFSPLRTPQGRRGKKKKVSGSTINV